MAATVIINEKNTAGETKTNKTSGTVRFKKADNALVDLADPLPVPTSNQTYAIEKFLQLDATVAPASQITDVEFYMDGSNDWPTGIKLWGRGLAAYTTPGQPVETNDPPQIPVGGTPAPATDGFTWTSASPLSLGAGPFSGTGDFADFVCLTMEVETGTVSGVLTPEQATFRWDEI